MALPLLLDPNCKFLPHNVHTYLATVFNPLNYFFLLYAQFSPNLHMDAEQLLLTKLNEIWFPGYLIIVETKYHPSSLDFAPSL